MFDYKATRKVAKIAINKNDDPLDFLVDTDRVKFCTGPSQFIACYNEDQVTILSL
jgi:hypothetical protein